MNEFLFFGNQIVDIFKLIFIFVIFILFGMIFISQIVSSIKYDIIEASKDRKFYNYMSKHSTGFYLKDINCEKDYIIITEKFFDNIKESGRIMHKYNLSDARKFFLIEMAEEYNIIVFISDGFCSSKYAKIVDLCKYDNLGVCRIIDYMPHNLVCKRKTLNDDSTVYYFQRSRRI